MMEFPEDPKSGTKILHRCQAFRCDDETSSDDRTSRVLHSDTVVYSKGGRIFVSRVTEERPWFLENVNLEELGGVEVNKDIVFPKFDNEKFTEAHEWNEESYYVKRPRLIDYKDEEDYISVGIGVLMLREASVCEALRKVPHPNIARYHGCIVEEGRIVGLCFEKYAQNLAERMEEELESAEKIKIYSQVRDAISHLHMLGYCHNDVHDRNVMITEDGDAVLIDFDSTVREGEETPYRGGAPGWSTTNDVAAKENDYFSLRKLREYLDVKGCDGGEE